MKTRKILSVVLTLCVLLVMCSLAAFAADGATTVKGTRDNPYTLEEIGAMTRDAYIEAQNTLGGKMYVTVGDYVYDKQGTLGNGKRDDTLHQTEDRSVLNGYNSNGYLGEKNDGANGKGADLYSIKRLNVSAYMTSEYLMEYISENITR